jgi:hypothetical protein
VVTTHKRTNTSCAGVCHHNAGAPASGITTRTTGAAPAVMLCKWVHALQACRSQPGRGHHTCGAPAPSKSQPRAQSQLPIWHTHPHTFPQTWHRACGLRAAHNTRLSITGSCRGLCWWAQGSLLGTLVAASPLQGELHAQHSSPQHSVQGHASATKEHIFRCSTAGSSSGCPSVPVPSTSAPPAAARSCPVKTLSLPSSTTSHHSWHQLSA